MRFKKIGTAKITFGQRNKERYAKLHDSPDAIEHEKPVTLPYNRKTYPPAPRLGDRHGQDVEPHGEYMSHGHVKSIDVRSNVVSGTVSFRKPYVVKDTENYTWKQDLAAKHGKKGKALSTHLTKKGYDGIVVMPSNSRYGNTPTEIVNLSGRKAIHEEELDEKIRDDHPHVGKPWHMKGSDLSTQHHGGASAVHKPSASVARQVGRRDDGMYGGGYYTTSDSDCADFYGPTATSKRRERLISGADKRHLRDHPDCADFHCHEKPVHPSFKAYSKYRRTINDRRKAENDPYVDRARDKHVVSTYKTHPHANVLDAHKTPERSHPDLIKAVVDHYEKNVHPHRLSSAIDLDKSVGGEHHFPHPSEPDRKIGFHEYREHGNRMRLAALRDKTPLKTYSATEQEWVPAVNSFARHHHYDAIKWANRDHDPANPSKGRPKDDDEVMWLNTKALKFSGKLPAGKTNWGQRTESVIKFVKIDRLEERTHPAIVEGMFGNRRDSQYNSDLRHIDTNRNEPPTEQTFHDGVKHTHQVEDGREVHTYSHGPVTATVSSFNRGRGRFIDYIHNSSAEDRMGAKSKHPAHESTTKVLHAVHRHAIEQKVNTIALDPTHPKIRRLYQDLTGKNHDALAKSSKVATTGSVYHIPTKDIKEHVRRIEAGGEWKSPPSKAACFTGNCSAAKVPEEACAGCRASKFPNPTGCSNGTVSDGTSSCEYFHGRGGFTRKAERASMCLNCHRKRFPDRPWEKKESAEGQPVKARFRPITEALSDRQKQMVNKWERGRHEFSDHAFGGPIETHHRVSVPLARVEDKDSNLDTPHELAHHLSQHGFEVHDFEKGLARKKGDRRPVRIGRVLERTKAPDHVKSAYVHASSRQGIKTKNTNYHVVISRHHHDVAGMSTGTGWDSCMSLDKKTLTGRKGTHARSYLPRDLTQGTHVAYLAHKDDKDLKNPVARIALKPRVSDKGHRILVPEKRAYGEATKEFHQTVNDWVSNNFKMKKGHAYPTHPALYNDSHEGGDRFKGDTHPDVYHSDPERRARAVMNYPTSKEVLHKLASDPHPYVRQAVASHRLTGAHTLEALHHDTDDNVLRSVAKHPNAPEHVLLKLADNPHTVHHAVAHQNFPHTHLPKFVNHPKAKVRAEVARSAGDPDVLHKLHDDGEPEVVQNVINNPATEAHTLAKHISTKEPIHPASGSELQYHSVLTHPNVNGDIIHSMVTNHAKHYLFDSHASRLAAAHPKTRPETLDFLAKNLHTFPFRHGVYGEIAANPNTHPDTIHHLVTNNPHARAFENTEIHAAALHAYPENKIRTDTLQHLSDHAPLPAHKEVAARLLKKRI
jgi:hypothetical protein